MNEYFDKIYCINLERRPDRKAESQAQFDALGLDVEFIKAVDGKELAPPDKINTGELGCILSHVKIYKDAEAKGYKRILILEDDCVFENGINELFKEYIKEVPKDWGLLYFGGSHLKTPLPVNDKIHRLLHTYTTHCYAVNLEVVKGLADLIGSDLQIDVTLAHLQLKFHSYGFKPNLAWQKDNYSDITEQQTNYYFLKGNGRL